MNLSYGEITALFNEDGIQMGKVRVAGVLKHIPMLFVSDARPGDTVLICNGVALSKVKNQPKASKNNTSYLAERRICVSQWKSRQPNEVVKQNRTSTPLSQMR